MQSKLPPHATLAPIIIATDKTQLTNFSGGKSAYPIYLTIGNLPKHIRRKPSQNACILLGYLSVAKMKRSNITELQHRSKVQRIFHESMRVILEPLKEAGKKGVNMRSSNGDIRQVHPILACYVADYPEQCLVTCSKYGTCCKCQQDADHLQESEPETRRTGWWTLEAIEKARKAAKGSTYQFHQACMEQNISGGIFVPFWKDFPFMDIHMAITPDVLHQLYQGVFKHLIGWCQSVVGEKVLDRRIQALPFGYGLRHFKTGISTLSQISGTERKNMAKILLGCIHDIMAPSGVKAVKSLLDFIYLAQYSTHDQITLGYLEDALQEFHKHKEYFVQVGCRDNLNFPKLHLLLHYAESIQFFGTTDNYNTEMFERLHIDFAKHGWRATNQKDEFPQMVTWLSRQEKVTSFHINLTPTIQIKSKKIIKSIAKHPSYPNRSISVIENLHQAPEFNRHLKQFLNTFLDSPTSTRSLNQTNLPDLFSLDVFKIFRFNPETLNEEEDIDLVRAIPKSQSLPHGHFDTVVVIDGDEAQATGLAGKCNIDIVYKLFVYL